MKRRMWQIASSGLSLSLLFLSLGMEARTNVKLPQTQVRGASRPEIQADTKVGDGYDISDPTRSSKIECCILKTVNDISARLQCQNAIPFGSAEINRPGGFVITEPGFYCLKEDVVFNPTFSTIAPPDPRAVQAAITIRSSNVFLYLGAHTLSQAGVGTSNQVPFCVGILVPDPLPASPDINAVGWQSIYIKGEDPAIIDGFSMLGIRIFAHVQDIRLQDITVKNCGLLASKALRPPASDTYGFLYLPHNSANPDVGPPYSVGGILIGEGFSNSSGPVFFVNPLAPPSNRMSQLNMQNVTCLNNYYIGTQLINMTDVVIDGCHFDYTFSDDIGSTTFPVYRAIQALGLYMFNGGEDSDANIKNFVMRNSTCNHTLFKNGDRTNPPNPAAQFSVVGGFLLKGDNCVFENCQFNDTSSDFGPTTSVTAAFASNALENCAFINCHFDNVTSLGATQGFHLSGANAPPLGTVSSINNRLINCTANQIRNVGSTQVPAPILGTFRVAGYILSFPKDLTLENCIAQDIILTTPEGNFVGRVPNVHGFLLEAIGAQTPPRDATVESIVFRNCIASRALAINGGSSAGFAVVQSANDALKSIVFDNCISSCNETMSPSLPAAWDVATVYAINATVSFSGSNYISLVNGNVGNTPNVSPMQWGLTIATASTLPVWVSTTNYPVGSIVSFNGIAYRSLSANTGVQPGTNAAIWTTTTNMVQGSAFGYYYQSTLDLTPEQIADIPTAFRNCMAFHNKGLPISFTSPTQATLDPLYTAGIYIDATLRAEVVENIISDNIYGIFLKRSNRCAIRNNLSDNNVDLQFVLTGPGGAPYVGEGYTDVGATGTATGPRQSLSIWESNRAFANGLNQGPPTPSHVGPNGNYNIWMDAALTLRPPLLSGQASTAVYTPTDPATYFASLHNNSVVS